MRLKGKTAIVTGATGGIGAATAKRYLQEGANTILVGRSKEKLDDLISNVPFSENALTHLAEATDEGAVIDCMNIAKDQFGSVDIVFANAGTEGIVQPLTEYSVEEFNHLFSINVTGVWLYMKHAIPIMKEQGTGSIIAVASAAGLVGFNGLCPYSASKHAVCGLVKTACIENGPFGIRVNALAPGPIDNRMMASLGEQLNPDDPQSVRDVVTDLNPMNRYGTNEEIANLALFLGSDESSYCTGAEFVADGGLMA